MATKISDLTAGTTLGGTEPIPMVQSAATVKTTPAAIYTYVYTTLTTTAGTPALTTDVVPVFRSGAAKYLTVSDFSTAAAAALRFDSLTDGVAVATGDIMAIDRSGLYRVTVDELADFVEGVLAAETAVDPPAVGDLLLLFRSGTTYTVSIDDMESYITDGIEEDTTAELPTYVTDLDTLAVAYLQAGDVFYVIRTTTPYQTSGSAIAQLAWDCATYGTVAQIQGCTANATPVAADKILVLDAGSSFAPTLSTFTNLWDNYLEDQVFPGLQVAASGPAPGTQLAHQVSLVTTANASDVNVRLPNPGTWPLGKPVFVVNTGGASAQTVTVSPYGGETIDGAATDTVAANKSAAYFTNGTNWWSLLGA